jgi:predicted small metal-binding protein
MSDYAIIKGNIRVLLVKGIAMEKFACKNLGLDCDFETTGATKEETMQKAMAHGNVVHADMMKEMNEEQMKAFGQQLVASIKPV